MHIDPGMNDSDKQRIRGAVINLTGLILCAIALWAMRCGRIHALTGTLHGVIPLKNALYLFLFTPLLIGLLWQLFLIASDGRNGKLSGLFVIGALCLGLGLGMHDAAANLAVFGKTGWTPQALQARHFYDEIAGHFVFWIGFILATVTTGLAHLYNPMQARQSRTTCAAFALLGLPLAIVMLGNLIFEHTGRDLVAIGIALGVILAVHAWKRVDLRQLPLLCLVYPAYVIAIAGTLLYWAVRS